jgi:hypothetical protein
MLDAAVSVCPQVVGEYMVEVWRAVGMDLSAVQFLSSSEEINKKPGALCYGSETPESNCPRRVRRTAVLGMLNIPRGANCCSTSSAFLC